MEGSHSHKLKPGLCFCAAVTPWLKFSLYSEQIECLCWGNVLLCFLRVRRKDGLAVFMLFKGSDFRDSLGVFFQLKFKRWQLIWSRHFIYWKPNVIPHVKAQVKAFLSEHWTSPGCQRVNLKHYYTHFAIFKCQQPKLGRYSNQTNHSPWRWHDALRCKEENVSRKRWA